MTTNKFQYILQENKDYILFAGAEFAILLPKSKFSMKDIEKKVEKFFGNNRVSKKIELKYDFVMDMDDIFVVKDIKNRLWDWTIGISGGKKHFFSNAVVKTAKKVAKKLFNDIKFKSNMSFVQMTVDTKPHVFMVLCHSMDGVDILIPPYYPAFPERLYGLCSCKED